MNGLSVASAHFSVRLFLYPINVQVPSLPQIHLHFCLSPAIRHLYLLSWGCFDSRISRRKEEQPRQLEARGKEASGVFLGGGGSVLPPNRSGKAVLVRKRIRLEIPRIL